MSGSLPESLDCGFGNAECGLLNSNSVLDLRFIIFNPKSEIQNHKSYGSGPLIFSVGGDK
jgi:hypothetical protein